MIEISSNWKLGFCSEMRDIYFSMIKMATSPIKLSINDDCHSDEYHYEYYNFNVGDNEVRLVCDDIGRFVRMELVYEA